jgi:hypothetical protein
MRKRPDTLVFPNVFIGAYEADILEITKSGYAHEFEVKLSRSDFKTDADKGTKYRHHFKHSLLQEGRHVNTFSYVVPKNMISVEECPEWAGLIYFEHDHFYVIKKARRLCSEKHGDRIKEKCLLSTYYRFHKYFK